MSLHTWHHQDPHKPSSCATFMLDPHWGRAATGKIKVLHLCIQGRFSRVHLFTTLYCGLPGFSVREGGSPGKNTGGYWPILAAIPFQSTVLPAALTANSPEYLVLSEPLQPKQLHHLHTWHSQGQTKVLQGNLSSKLQWTAHIQKWK